MVILITGVTGFIGSSILRFLIEKTNHDVIGFIRNENTEFNCLLKNLSGHSSRISLVKSFTFTNVDIIIHCAASAQVPLTIKNPQSAFDSNVVFTSNLLDYVKNSCLNLKKFIYLSTGEVYGPNENDTKWVEKDRLKCLTPYSATKAAGECLVQGYSFAYEIPSVILRIQSVFGERQLSTKFFSQILTSIISNKLIHLNGSNIKNTTLVNWMHVEEVANALIFLIDYQARDNCEIYNLTGEKEISLFESVVLIGNILSKKFNYQIDPVDILSRGSRCSISNDKINSLGFKQEKVFERRLVEFIDWTLINIDRI